MFVCFLITDFSASRVGSVLCYTLHGHYVSVSWFLFSTAVRPFRLLKIFLPYILSRNNARSRNMKCTIQNRTVLFGKDKAEESSVLFLTDWSAWPKWTKVWSATTPLRARVALETFFYAVTYDSLLSTLVWWSRHHPIPLQTLSVQDSVRLKKKMHSSILRRKYTWLYSAFNTTLTFCIPLWWEKTCYV